MGTATGNAPFVRRKEVPVGPVATAGNDLTTILGRAPFTGVVTAVTYSTVTAITGANTNSRTVSLVNKGQSGAGTTVIATIAYTSGVNTVAFDENTVTVSVTAADLNVVEGDILAWTSVHVGTGIADPGGTVIVSFSRD
jgi:hypothetical protein